MKLKLFTFLIAVMASFGSLFAQSGTCGDNLTWNLTDGVLTISGTGAMADYQNATQTPWNGYSSLIQSVIMNDNVTTVSNYAFAFCSNLKNVSLNQTLTTIGEHAFFSCPLLESVVIPDNVIVIGYNAFAQCSWLTSVHIGNKVTTIGKGAFARCGRLSSVVMFNSVTSIGENAFYGCSGLTSVTIPNSVASIGDGAFNGCSNLTTITNFATTPQPLDPDGISVFGGVPLACTLYVPAESVEAYQTADVWKEFGNILAIEDEPAPCVLASGTCGAEGDNLTWTLSCDSVLTISGTGAMANYEWNYTEQKLNTPWYSNQESIKSIIIDDGVTSIGAHAFDCCWDLTSVTIPNSVTSIGGSAFEYCWSLTSVTIPNSVISIGNSAFAQCVLTSVTIPNSVTSIGYFAFARCGSLTSINVVADNLNYCSVEGMLLNKDKTVLVQYPKGKKGDYNIPSSVTNIGTGAFAYCNDLNSIEIPNGIISIGDYAFWDSRGLTSVVIPNSVTRIGESAFAYCNSLTYFTNYATAPQTINANVFDGVNKSTCTLYVPAESLETYQAADVWKDFGNILAIEDEPAPCVLASGTCGAQGDNLTWTLTCDSVLAISGTGEMTDYEWSSAEQSPTNPWNSYREIIKFISLPDGLTSIGDNAFYGCSGLTSVEIPNSVTSIGSSAFRWCYGLTSVEIPNSVTSIGSSAFMGCTGLTSVTIGNSVTRIGDYAFYNCSGLTSVTIPNNVTSIGDYAFDGCSGLTSVTIPNSVTSIGGGAFMGCTGLTSVTIPNSVTSIGVVAFFECTGLTSVTIPNSVISIGESAFAYCNSLTYFTNYATAPQTINANVFDGVNKSTCTLYVPAESLETYQAADVWKDFGNILAIEGDLPVGPTEGEFNVLYITQDGDSISSEAVMLHLPVAPEIAGFTFLKWQVVAGDLENGIIIQAVYQANEYTSAPEVYTNPANPAQKLIRNGNVYILTDDKIYSITGQTVK